MESKFDGMESIWNGIEMDNFWEKRSVGYVVLMEREWNGNGMEFFFDKSSGNKL